MNKIIIILSFIFLANISFSQEFLGVKVNGKKADVINAYKAKGFAITKVYNDINVVSMSGKVGENSFDINIVYTPKTNIVWKVSVYLPPLNDWPSLKEDYYKYLKILTEKYGQPVSKYDFFASPYKEGDGNEMTAVENEKCHYSAYWSDLAGVYMSISKWSQVIIRYENAKNSKLAEKEKNELEKSIF